MSLPPHLRYEAKLFPGSSHSWALQQFADVGTGSAILDFGSGSGVMGAALKERGFTTIDTVEVSEEARTATASLYRYSVGAPEALPADQKYQVILILDVLEHLPDPAALIQFLLPRLAVGGKLILSVPNIAHWSVRLMLLTGFFDPMERGPLDKTHLKFFTVRSFLAFLARFPALAATEINGSIVPLEIMLPTELTNNELFNLWRKMRIWLARAVPSVFGYQILVALRKEPG